MHTTAAPVTMAEQVVSLFRGSRNLMRDELPACSVLQLPQVTAAGLDAAGAAVQVQPELAVAVGLVVQRAKGFPASARRRRVLTGLAKWLKGVPAFVQVQERWFCTRVVRDAAEASAGTATPAEVAGLIALSILTPD